VPARHIPGAPRTGFIGDAIHPFSRSGTWRERLAIALANNFFKWGLMLRGGSGRSATRSQMIQESFNMSRCLRKVAFDRAFTATVLVAALAAVSPILAARGPGKAPKIGEEAPPFSLLDLDGQRITLDGELTHGPVVLVLLRGWPGYQCPFCTRQFADFLGHASAFEDAGARVVWV
jgi:hypothetical protein